MENLPTPTTTTATKSLAFIDLETGLTDGKAHDLAAFREPDLRLHTKYRKDFLQFVENAEFICGHNILYHDLKYLPELTSDQHHFIDTLFLSPLLFPKKPYHKLLKDDKLQTDDLNNPLNDCLKARDLFFDEIGAFNVLPPLLKDIYTALLSDKPEFEALFKYVEMAPPPNFDISQSVKQMFADSLCRHSRVDLLTKKYPVELAYTLALIYANDSYSVTPSWLRYNYPQIENVVKLLCGTPCHANDCPYCNSKLNIHTGLRNVFGHDKFRLFDGEPMQEMAVQSAMDGESLLAIFPTGGGKSLTFQLPAIMTGRAAHALTVVISPLQSLMKDQVDNLSANGITEAVTINGLLDPVSRADAFERVENGSATLLYISPEMLRSKTIEKLLISRNIARFVIDEAHCFSAWGQDFRVDYLYIGDFIRKLQEKKQHPKPIPVSCFTATAKQKVISDIRDYFDRKLGLTLRIFASSAERKNLHYSVIYSETEDDKYCKLRELMLANPCPTIIYVSRTRKTAELAMKLTRDGLKALPFNGQMESNNKISNQNAFIANEVRAIVATSAFGMGVDKKDVGLVIHYDISDSLENYVQEAGRAGRDPNTSANCYVLYSDHDLDKHFILLNQTKVSISEIQQVWRAIKNFTRKRDYICCSPLEIAREAGWNDEVCDVETRVKTCVAALDEAGYVNRGNNVPHVFATGIMVKNMDEARLRITKSPYFYNDNDRQNAARILKSLISKKYTSGSPDDEAESRVDYLADRLGLSKETVIRAVSAMRQEGILADTNDMSAFIDTSEQQSQRIFENATKLERFVLSHIAEQETEISYKTLNELAQGNGIPSNIKSIKTILYFLSVKSYLRKNEHPGNGIVNVSLTQPFEQTLQKHDKRVNICKFIIGQLHAEAKKNPNTDQKNSLVQFSLTSLLKGYINEQENKLFTTESECSIGDVEDALLYLSKIGAMKLEGGFLVFYNAMEIHRLTDTKHSYKREDYRLLDEFYKQKIRQIHIVGKYANLMVSDYNAALQYVQDYFQMDFKKFIAKYFDGDQLAQIEKNITPAKYKQLFGELSAQQRKIITDKESKYIVVAAGPGSGKTRVLVHKLASLLLLEDVKHEQLLMLTFSRAAATEFKQRLMELIGNAAHFVEIKTFHAFCFDILGKVGNLEDAGNVVKRATEMIEAGEAEQGKINRSVLVIDEAQDMDADEHALIRALMRNNEEMRVIAVGDDDQNIYQFRGSNSMHMQSFVTEMGAVKYEMTENYRSLGAVVDFSNCFVQRIANRMKIQPNTAVRSGNGAVVITQCISANLEVPVADTIAATYHGQHACVITRTNFDAAQMVGQLSKKGIPAKLIQSTEGFRFCNLAEVRFFLKNIDSKLQSPVINDELWENAKQRTLEVYKTSSCIEYIRQFIATFESTHRTKYRTDLADFVFESSLEDFFNENQSTILVSTIHKAKGREFDTVYLYVEGDYGKTDEELRALYVGMTRARNNLYIHCNTNLFTNLEKSKAVFNYDPTPYPDPDEITIQPKLSDVFLDFCKPHKEKILGLASGRRLGFDNGFLLTSDGQRIASLSKSLRDELADWYSKGFNVVSAKVAFIIAWKGKDEPTDAEETAVVLPYLLLRQNRK